MNADLIEAIERHAQSDLTVICLLIVAMYLIGVLNGYLIWGRKR